MPIEPPDLMPKPAFASLDCVFVVPAGDSWAVRRGFAASAVLAGSVGFQISAPDPASAHRYVAVCCFLDLTLSSPWMVFSCCWMFRVGPGRFGRMVSCVRDGDLV